MKTRSRLLVLVVIVLWTPWLPGKPDLGDPDGDGMPTGYEQLAGTDPWDAHSVLSIALATNLPHRFSFSFPAASQRLYRIEGSADLQTWQTLADGISGAGQPESFEMTATNGPQFFRVALVGARVTNSPLANLVWINPGQFLMGSPANEMGRVSDEAQHEVVLTRGYWIGQYEVTQGEYLSVMNTNPACFYGDPRLPVDNVSWYEAGDYCRELTARERAHDRLPLGYEYRLPTEAEWEYACRAGTTGLFGLGDGSVMDFRVANMDGARCIGALSTAVYLGRTTPVGSYPPNAWKLYDMHGNLWEWCLDHYSVPGASPVVDPAGPASGSTYIARGGSWGSWGIYCRAAFRPQLAPSVKTRYFGFRVVLAEVNSATRSQGPPQVSPAPAMTCLSNLFSPAARLMEKESTSDSAGFDPVVILGQSNAVGETDMSNPEPSDPSVWMFGLDYRFKLAYEPVFDCTGQIDLVNLSHIIPTSPYGHSWSLRAAKGVTASINRQILLVPCAASSTSLQSWMPGPDRFDRSTLYGAANTRRSIAARQGVKVIWFYGHESNSHPPYLEHYAEDWQRLIWELWSDWGPVPIVFVQLARCADPYGFGMVDWMWEGAEIQRQIETGSGSDKSMPLHFMVPAFDLPMQDWIHLNRKADDILADRIARATRQHVYGEPINGTGPRLVSLTHPLGDKTTIRIALTRPVNTPVNRYDHLFHAYVRGKEVPILDVQRDTNPSVIRITLAKAADAPVSIGYGGNRGDSVNTRLLDVVKDADGLPLPQFFDRPVYDSLGVRGLEESPGQGL